MARKLKKGDMVVVISGDSRHLPDEKRTGSIKTIDKAKGRVIVSGINIRKVAQKRTSANQQGGFIERECPIHISNVMLKERYDNQFEEESE